jgi:hypothetical protein
VHIRRTEIPTLVKAYGLGIDGQLRGRGADVRDDPASDVARMPLGGRCRGPPTTPAIRNSPQGEIRADRRRGLLLEGRTSHARYATTPEVRSDAMQQDAEVRHETKTP